MNQLILHLVGDYLTQSDWMAQNKRNAWFPAFVHALIYSLPFLLLTTHIRALTCIFGTHLLIDRFGLARYVVWTKNWIGLWRRETEAEVLERLRRDGIWSRDSIPALLVMELNADDLKALAVPRSIPPTPAWRECSATGYPPERPAWLAVWLLIVADNTLHLAINYSALRWL